MKYCYFCFMLLLVASCTLSSSQEASLHKALTSYIDAHNNGEVMAYVAYTHPNVVGFFEDQGDSLFREKFELFSTGNGGDYLQDGTLKEIEKKNNQIHVRYVFDSYTEIDYNSIANELGLIAISVDDGESWYFVEEDDYTNEKIFSKDEQLIAL
ncbi:MAG: hypothetical protein HWE22_14295 [Flavobacteriales bacterium]|nr:hypothetical protein [Flavobacteriales bacterium]